MKLVVVTPTLGSSRWLPATIASLPVGSRHVLVAPAVAATELSARWPGTMVVTEPGGGMYAAINTGLKAAGEWDAFTYINDDDVLLPAFSRVIDAADGAGPCIAYGGVRLIDAAGRRLGAIPVSPCPTLNPALYAQRIEPVYQHGTIVTRAAWEKIGGFDASFRFCGDSEFLARACLSGVQFVRACRAEVAAFRLRSGQLTKNRNVMIAERARVDEKLRLVAPQRTARHRWAKLVFRFSNAAIFAERIARHGFVTFDTLLARAKDA